ncbi:uncharacterized protein EMH_0095040 [Eimeria mitis]|uniref:Uncharacterized protein n=1 Tax=Eimeria mitis TaxID=44415 RepID=U6KIU7_9EIME|nr:uncharacterized protein EMH_0095040 [Eimeria mitis]CDJ36741.1 hypothetical protein, conserved [Eimeria mitis]
MNTNNSWAHSPAAAAGGAADAADAATAATAAAAAAQPAAAQKPVDPAVCAEVERRMQHADDFWKQLEAAAAAAAEVGPQRAPRFVSVFRQAHEKKLQAANLEQLDQLAAQIFSALQQQQN